MVFQFSGLLSAVYNMDKQYWMIFSQKLWHPAMLISRTLFVSPWQTHMHLQVFLEKDQSDVCFYQNRITEAMYILKPEHYDNER